MINKGEHAITNDVPSFSNWGAFFYFATKPTSSDTTTQGFQLRKDHSTNKMAMRSWTDDHGTKTFSDWGEITTQGYLNSYTSLSSLASALGAYKSKNYTAIDSASTLLSSLESGKFYFKGSTIHPSDEPTSGACIIYTEYTIEGSPANFGSQYAYCLSDGAYYVRYWWGSAWMDWQRLDNFGCNTPSALASLLGALYPNPVFGSGDMNSLTTPGCYVIDNRQSGVSNCPISTMGHLIVTITDSAYSVVQILQKTQGGTSTHIRYKWGQAWGAWHEIALNIPDFYKSYANIGELATGLGGIMFAGAEVASNTDFVDIAPGMHYYGNPATASDAPTEIMKSVGSIDPQGIVIKSGSTTDMGRGLMVFINRWGIAAKWKGSDWEENWTYLVTL